MLPGRQTERSSQNNDIEYQILLDIMINYVWWSSQTLLNIDMMLLMPIYGYIGKRITITFLCSLVACGKISVTWSIVASNLWS